MSVTVGCIVALAYLAVGAILNGVAIKVLWDNFVSYHFGVPEISIVAALAVSMILGLMTDSVEVKNDTKEKRIVHTLSIVTKPIFALIVAAILLLFR